MSLRPDALVAILGMAIVTYIARAGGLWLSSRIALTKRMEAGLGNVPGAVLIAIVAPAVWSGGIAEKVAALTTAAVAVRTRNLLLSMVIGVAVVLVIRHVGGGRL